MVIGKGSTSQAGIQLFLVSNQLMSFTARQEIKLMLESHGLWPQYPKLPNKKIDNKGAMTHWPARNCESLT